MQTHRDDDAVKAFEVTVKAIKELEGKAVKMIREGTSRITAGAPGEKVLHEEDVGPFTIRQLPIDPLCLRISIGEIPSMSESAYLVFRGDLDDVIDLLERALAAMRVSHICKGDPLQPPQCD